MAIFNSYVSLPEGTPFLDTCAESMAEVFRTQFVPFSTLGWVILTKLESQPALKGHSFCNQALKASLECRPEIYITCTHLLYIYIYIYIYMYYKDL
jgi:hypothetical protein